MKHYVASALLAQLASIAFASSAVAEIIVFRNVAQAPIRFSLRADSASQPVTQDLGVGERIAFDLQSTGRFDICATGLDELNGTFGISNVGLRELQARMRGNVVEVDGILKKVCTCEDGRIVRKEKRAAVLLKFPLNNCCRSQLVLKIRPASDAYKQWFYYDGTPRIP